MQYMRTLKSIGMAAYKNHTQKFNYIYVLR